MPWLDPGECAAARECIERGHVREAARALSSSPHREHKAIRRMLLEVSAKLVEDAARAHAEGEIRLAWELIHDAEQCACLSGKAALLRERIVQEREEMEKQRDWQQDRMRRAKARARQGRLRTAIGLVSPLDGDPDAARVRQDLEERLERFERYVRECQQLLDAGEVEAARGPLERAREIMPSDPEVVRLAGRLPRDEAPVTPAETAQVPGRRIDPSLPGFGLADLALVVLAPEALVGTPRGEGVHLAILGKMHRCHARIVRSAGFYRVEPCDSRCSVRVNDRDLAGPRKLHDGDRIGFGGLSSDWVFRLPVPGSLTAVLEQSGPPSNCACTADGRSYRQVVLVDHFLVVRPRGPAHVVLRDLPCRELRLRWSKDRLIGEARDGLLILEAPGCAAAEAPAPLRLPSRLVVQPELEEAEILIRAFAGDEVQEILHLDIHDAYQVATFGA